MFCLFVFHALLMRMIQTGDLRSLSKMPYRWHTIIRRRCRQQGIHTVQPIGITVLSVPTICRRRSFRANYLPSVSLISNPYLNRQINKITQPDGTEQFIRQNKLSTDLGLQISQNVSFTGGNFFVQTSTQRIDEFGSNGRAYNTQPISVGYSQSLFGYNYLKWDKRIEPVRYREACKTYAETMELIASRTSQLFYALASAQTNLNIARSNYASADTLYRYARGRYNIGSITENEMLQLEVNKLNEETNMMNAGIEVEDAMLTLRSFLGINDDAEIEVIPADSIYYFDVPLDEALKFLQTAYTILMYRLMRLSNRHTRTVRTSTCIKDRNSKAAVSWHLLRRQEA